MVASFWALAGRSTTVDCDVDAADLHLVLRPTLRERWPFVDRGSARIDPLRCTGCGQCAARCRFGAVRITPGMPAPTFSIDPFACEGCGACVDVCAEGAVELVPGSPGEWSVSDTRHGPLVHARLGIAQENSGKLVSLVRREARALATEEEMPLLLGDGPPGIGCPVIASITGAHRVLLVTEPTPSGLHDLSRVAELCRRLRVEAAVCVNEADINAELADEIETTAAALGLPMLGRIRYDDAVTAAQLRGVSVVEYGDSPAARDIRALWRRVQQLLALGEDHPTARRAAASGPALPLVTGRTAGRMSR